MKNLGIKSRVIFLGTIPALLFAMIVAGYAISNVFGVLNQSLRDRGRIIAEQLAPAAEYGVISGNAQILQRLAQQALSSEQDLRSVLIIDSNDRVLALSGRELPQALMAELKKENIQEYKLKGGMIFISPIYRSLVEVDDFSSLRENDKTFKSADSQLEIGRVYVDSVSYTHLDVYKRQVIHIKINGL